jgi:hypothetical protein
MHSSDPIEKKVRLYNGLYTDANPFIDVFLAFLFMPIPSSRQIVVAERGWARTRARARLEDRETLKLQILFQGSKKGGVDFFGSGGDDLF